jgi:hypothetical protein
MHAHAGTSQFTSEGRNSAKNEAMTHVGPWMFFCQTISVVMSPNGGEGAAGIGGHHDVDAGKQHELRIVAPTASTTAPSAPAPW